MDDTGSDTGHSEMPIIRYPVFEGDFLRLEYTGVPPQDAERVIIAFPPFDYPFDPSHSGWGSRSLAKRGISHVTVFHKFEDWYQNNEFFRAMQVVRKYVGARTPITAYGFSMGGYGARLSAYILRADLVVAISPQYSIDPETVPFDGRYMEQWLKMDGWLHDVDSQIYDPCDYVIVIDPLHLNDTQQEALYTMPPRYSRVLMHGVGHAALPAMIQTGAVETLFEMLMRRASPQDLRRAYRETRRSNFRYVRKIGWTAIDRNSQMVPEFIAIAREKKFYRLLKKWVPLLEERAAAGQ